MQQSYHAPAYVSAQQCCIIFHYQNYIVEWQYRPTTCGGCLCVIGSTALDSDKNIHIIMLHLKSMCTLMKSSGDCAGQLYRTVITGISIWLVWQRSLVRCRKFSPIISVFSKKRIQNFFEQITKNTIHLCCLEVLTNY